LWETTTCAKPHKVYKNKQEPLRSLLFTELKSSMPLGACRCTRDDGNERIMMEMCNIVREWLTGGAYTGN